MPALKSNVLAQSPSNLLMEEGYWEASQRYIYNPHSFGLDTRELFFQKGRIIVIEGQEDVLLFPNIAE